MVLQSLAVAGMPAAALGLTKCAYFGGKGAVIHPLVAGHVYAQSVINSLAGSQNRWSSYNSSFERNNTLQGDHLTITLEGGKKDEDGWF